MLHLHVEGLGIAVHLVVVDGPGAGAQVCGSPGFRRLLDSHGGAAVVGLGGHDQREGLQDALAAHGLLVSPLPDGAIGLDGLGHVGRHHRHFHSIHADVLQLHVHQVDPHVVSVALGGVGGVDMVHQVNILAIGVALGGDLGEVYVHLAAAHVVRIGGNGGAGSQRAQDLSQRMLGVSGDDGAYRGVGNGQLIADLVLAVGVLVHLGAALFIEVCGVLHGEAQLGVVVGLIDTQDRTLATVQAHDFDADIGVLIAVLGGSGGVGKADDLASGPALPQIQVHLRPVVGRAGVGRGNAGDRDTGADLGGGNAGLDLDVGDGRTVANRWQVVGGHGLVDLGVDAVHRHHLPVAGQVHIGIVHIDLQIHIAAVDDHSVLTLGLAVHSYHVQTKVILPVGQLHIFNGVLVERGLAHARRELDRAQRVRADDLNVRNGDTAGYVDIVLLILGVQRTGAAHQLALLVLVPDDNGGLDVVVLPEDA